MVRDKDRVRKVLIVLAILCASAVSGYAQSSMLPILLAAAVGMALLFQHPGLGLVAMAGLSFTLPLEIGTGSEIALSPPVLLIPAVVLGWLAEGLRKGSVQLTASRTTLPLLLFVASGILSLLAGTVYWDPTVPRASNLVLVQLAQWAIFAFSAAIYLVAGELGQRGKWLRIATWLFVILGAIVVLEDFIPGLHDLVGWSDPSRAKSGVFWPWLGALAVGQLVFNRRLGPLAKLALLVLLLTTTWLLLFGWSDWLSGWGPYMIAVATVVWLWIWRRSRAAGVAALLVGVALAVVLYPIVFTHAGGQEEVDVSWGGRLVLYRAVMDLTKSHPLLGLGPAAYRHYGFVHWLSEGFGGALYLRPNLSSHNNYIDIYAQMGLLGVGLFAWFLVEQGLLGWSLTNRFHGDFEDGYVHGALGGLVGSLVAMMLVDWFLPYVYNVGFDGFRTSALSWMFLGGLVALQRLGDEDTEHQGDGQQAHH